MESLIPQTDGGRGEVDWTNVLDRIAVHPRQLLYLHPCRAYFEEFWDAANFNRGNLVPFGKWKPCTQRPEADTRLYYARLRELIRRLRAEGRFTFPTLVEKAAAEEPRQDITRDDLPFLAAHMRTRIDMTADPLAALDRFPPLRDFRPAGTWIYWPQFKDAYASDRLRWQLWTMRYEPTNLASCLREGCCDNI